MIVLTFPFALLGCFFWPKGFPVLPFFATAAFFLVSGAKAGTPQLFPATRIISLYVFFPFLTMSDVRAIPALKWQLSLAP